MCNSSPCYFFSLFFLSLWSLVYMDMYKYLNELNTTPREMSLKGFADQSRELWLPQSQTTAYNGKKTVTAQRRIITCNSEWQPFRGRLEGDLRVNDRLTYVRKIFLKPSEKLLLSLVRNRTSIQTRSFIQSVVQQTVIMWILYAQHCLNCWVCFHRSFLSIDFFPQNMLSLFDQVMEMDNTVWWALIKINIFK